MSNYLINRAFQGDSDALVERAKVAIRTHQIGDGVASGRLDGDGAAGSFSVATLVGDVVGLYKIDQNELHIEITAKPMLVSNDAIAEEIDGFLRKAS